MINLGKEYMQQIYNDVLSSSNDSYNNEVDS